VILHDLNTKIQVTAEGRMDIDEQHEKIGRQAMSGRDERRDGNQKEAASTSNLI
jgi:hypothetical protein